MVCGLGWSAGRHVAPASREHPAALNASGNPRIACACKPGTPTPLPRASVAAANLWWTQQKPNLLLLGVTTSFDSNCQLASKISFGTPARTSVGSPSLNGIMVG